MSQQRGIKWAAGLFEGEGSFTVNRTKYGEKEYLYLQLQLAMTDEDVVIEFQRIMNHGKICLPSVRSHYKQQYKWQLQGAAAIECAWKLLPYLCERRQARFLELILRVSEARDE